MHRSDERMKRRIEGDLARVNAWIATLLHESRPEELESAGDNTPLTEEGDVALAGEENEIRFRLLDSLGTRVRDLQAALQRIREDVYGICTRCGKAIHPERLEAVPEAALCLACQGITERRRAAHRAATPHWIEAATALQARREFD